MTSNDTPLIFGSNVTLDNGGCTSDVQWPEEWPLIGRAVGVVVVALYLLLSVVSLALLYKRRNHSPLRSRHAGLVATPTLGGVILVLTIGLREFFTRSEFPCDWYILGLFLTYPPALGPILVRALQHKNRIEWQRKLKDIPLSPPIGMSLSGFVASKYRASRRLAYLALLVICLVLVLIVLVYFAVNDEYGKGCRGCNTSIGDLILILVMILGLASGIIVGLVRLMRSSDDGQSNHAEMKTLKLLCALMLFFFVLWFILQVVDPGDLHSNGYLSWTYMVVLSFVTYIVIEIIIPVRQTYKSNNFVATGKEFERVLLDPVLLELFEKFLQEEFSSENLRFYHEASRWSRSYPGPDADPFSLQEWRTAAVDIYRTFVRSDGLLQINLSSKITRQLRHEFEERVDEKSSSRRSSIAVGYRRPSPGTPSAIIQQHERENTLLRIAVAPNDLDASIFDGAIKEVFNIMKTDSFGRFAQTSSYKQRSQTGLTAMSSTEGSTRKLLSSQNSDGSMSLHKFGNSKKAKKGHKDKMAQKVSYSSFSGSEVFERDENTPSFSL